MTIYDRSQTIGHHVEMMTKSTKHIDAKDKAVPSDDPVQPFAKVLMNAVNHVNGLQIDSDNLEQTLITHPEEVNIHEVMLASEKARLSVSLLKSVVEKAIKAYQEIMMIR